MSNQEVVAAYRRTIEARISDTEAEIHEAEKHPTWSSEFKATWIEQLRKQITRTEQELLSYDSLMKSILNAA